jgi:hypothetical protein
MTCKDYESLMQLKRNDKKVVSVVDKRNPLTSLYININAGFTAGRRPVENWIG